MTDREKYMENLLKDGKLGVLNEVAVGGFVAKNDLDESKDKTKQQSK
jgi:hypothetical protein